MKTEKLKQLGHLIAGIITLIYGFENFESGAFLSSAYYLSLAIIFLIVAGSHKWIAEKFLMADVAFYLLESATIIYSGWNYKLKGHHYLFYTMLFAGLVFFIFAILSLKTEDKPKRRRSKSRKRKRYSTSNLPPNAPGENKEL